MARKLAKKQPKLLHYEELEQRVLFSADVAPGLEMDVDDEQALVEDVNCDLQAEREEAESRVEQDDAAVSSELVFVNENVTNYEQLIAGLQEDDNRIIEVMVLDADRDGIEQVSEILSERSGLAAVHFITHGADGQINLGNSWLNNTSLQQNSDAVSGWGNALIETGDILFYGCNVAVGGDGQSLLEDMAKLTGADVAASDDNTGHTIFGGDWDLEFNAGRIETSAAFSQGVQDTWGHLLNVAVDNTSTGTSTTNSLTISHTTSGTDRLMLVGVSLNKGTGTAVSSISYNGDALTLVGTSSNGDAVAEIWQLVNPDLGTHNVNIILNGTTDGNAAGVMTFTGVDQTTALGTFGLGSGNSGGTGAATISSAPGELVFGIVAVDEDTDYDLVPGADQTEDPNGWDLYPGNGINAGGSTKAGAASVNVSWTWPGSDNWAIGGVSIKPSSGNTAPTINLPGAALNYTEGDGALAIDVTATATDPDSSDFDSGTLAIDFAAGGTANDRLAICNQGTGTGQIGVSGSNVTYNFGAGAVTIGTFTGGTDGATPLLITLNADADVTAVQALMRNITFENVSENPSTASRTVRFVLTDGDGGTSEAATETINVAAVNDAPVLDNSGFLTLTTISEDDTGNSGNLVSEIIASDGGDRITDPDAGALEGIAITILESGNGTWEYDVGSGWTAVGAVSDTSALLLRANDSLRFVPDGFSADNAFVTFCAWDQTSGTAGNKVDASSYGGATAFSEILETAAITVTAVNDAPTAADSMVTTNEDTTYIFTAADFNFDDVDGDTLASIKITSLETVGSLKLSDWDVTLNQVITKADIDAGNLKFVPVADANGSPYDSFGFRVNDGTVDSASTYTMTVDVTAVNDAPVVSGVAKNGYQDRDIAFSADDFTDAFSDIEGDALTQIRIASLPSNGILKFSGSAVGIGDVIAVAQVGNLTFTPSERWTGSTNFSWEGYDGTDWSTASALVSLSIETEIFGANDLGQLYRLDATTGAYTYLDDLSFSAYGLAKDPTTGVLYYTESTSSNARLGSYDPSSGLNTVIGNTGIPDYIDRLTFKPDGTLIAMTGGSVVYSLDTGTGASTVIGTVTGSPANGDVTFGAGDEMYLVADGAPATGLYSIDYNNLVVNGTTGANLVGTITPPSKTGNLSGVTYVEGNLYVATAGGELYVVDPSDASIISTLNTGAPKINDLASQTIPLNESPTISSIADQVIDEDTDTGSLAFTIGDAETDASSLIVNASSSNQTLIPDGNLVLGGTDANRTITVTPANNQNGGPVTITVTVSDGVNTTVETFDVTVNAVNDAPVDLRTTATTDGGINLNNDGGNDTYLVADNGGELLGGLTTVTIEASFSITTPGADLSPLLSYAQGSNDEELALFLKHDGCIWFGVQSNGSVLQSTVGSYNQLFDGEVHHVGVSWDSSNGAVEFYVDGQGVESFTGYQTGLTIAAGGELVLGQDQDSVLGGFKTWDVFSGSLYDVRIFNDVRTAPEIADNYDQTLPNTEPGMIANWTFDNMSTGGVITESVSGNNLTEQHVVDAGFIASTPELTLAVWENALDGAVIGSLTAVDPDSGDTFSYTLLDDAGGRFSINALNGQITLVDSALLDFESATSHNITARVTDSGGLTYDEVFTINVLDANEFTPVANDATIGINEDAANGTLVHTVVASDADGTAVLTYAIIGGNADGLFAIDANTGEITIADNTNLDRETTASYGLTVQVSDGTYTDNATITVNVGDVDEFDVGPVTDSDVAANTVAEDAIAGTAVGVTALADDADATDNVTYSLSDDAGGLFSIDANTGVITVANALDYETATSHSVTVLATSSDTSTSSQAFTISVTNVNEGAVGPVSDTDAAADAVNENAVLGATVGVTAYATDPDAGDIVTYSLDDDAGGLFTIDNNTGVVTVAGALDAETATSHNITIRATSSDTSFSITTLSITVNDVDEFDVEAVTDADATANTVSEDAIVGTTVGVTALAEDADATDTVSYSLSDDAGGRFAIDANTGVITVNSALDYETNTSHAVTVLATSSDGSTSSQSFTINVTDVNESAVGPVTDSNAAGDTVAEDAIAGTTVGITANATDPDGTDTVTYSLDDDAGGLFTIDANTGVVTVAGALDAETATSHNITIRATSSDTSFSTTTLAITVNDINEFAPVANDATVAINEDAANGTSVHSVVATDADATATLTYAITGGNADGVFAIDANTGEITIDDNTNLDRETTASYGLTVQVSDGTNTDSATITVNVGDVDEFDVGPVSDTDGTANTVSENAVVGTAVGVTAFATDADVTDIVTYSLSDDADGRFAIDANTGVITIVGALDYEANTSHSVTVLATSSDGSTSSQSFTITVTDVNESPVGAVSDVDATADAVDENALVGTTVGVTANATDPDGTDTVTYSLDDDAGGLFAIDANTGVVTVAGVLDAETATSHNITIRATSSDTSFSTTTLSIAVNDINEFTPVANDATVAINEDATNGTSGHTVAATDADATATLTYAITGGNADGVFAIDANTGEITIADNTNLDRETTASYVLTVEVSDGTNTDSATITVNVGDVDEFDVGAVTDADGTANTAAEDAVVGTAVGITALATDADATDTVSYSLSDTAGGRFAIDANTGVITVNGALDYETNTSHSVTVLATSTDGSTSSQAFTINVTDVSESSVGPVTDTDATANAVDENAIAGTTVGMTANATDPDGTDTVTYSLDDDAGGLFTIDANTGVVTVAGALDAESATSQNITIRATSSDTSFSITTLSITVNDVDEFDVGAVTDADATANTVAEDAIASTAVGVTALATDSDVTDTVTYSLSDDAGGRFAIDSNTGIITVNGALDYEANTSHSVTVLATSSDGSTSSQSFTINVTDVNESAVGPVTDSNAAANTVTEDAIAGTTVGITTLASDPDGSDTVTYSLSDDAGGLFTIDADTGVITVANALDYETATSHSVTVLATSSDTSTSSQAFTISVTDVNEGAVGAISDTDATANAVDEDAIVGTTVGVTANATDPDAGDTVTYSLDGDAGGLFTIDSNTGVVTVAGALDAETATSHSITIRATSSDTSFTTTTLSITVNDIDEFDVGPVTDSDVVANNVAEDAIVGTTVGVTALANDADVSDNVTYSLSDNAGGRFAMDANTGVITVNGALDYEANTSHSVTVLATSDDGSTSSQSFTINVTDVNESAVGPVTDSNAAANTVTEDAIAGTTVGITALASDPDGSDTVTYSLSDDAGGLFTIDANTGVITVANALDYETATSHSVTVLATSSDTSTSSQSFTINVTDINESAIGAVTDSDGAANIVAENALVGDTVGITALATDPDAGDTVTYSLSDDAGGLFAIDANTGVITVANALDYETATSHSVSVLATSSDTSTSSQAFTISVTDVNEGAVGPVSDTDGAADGVNENAVLGATVGVTAYATDPDGGDTVTYSLDGDAGGLFTIDSNTGVVTVAGALDAESATSHSITIRATSSDTSFSTTTLSISVNDVDEFDVGPVTDSDAGANIIAEDAIVGTTVGVTALANDADVTDNVTYSLSDDAGGRFAIDANTGVITVNGALDYETSTSHSVTVRATSSDGSTSTQSFTINVTDVNDNAPVADTESFTVAEGGTATEANLDAGTSLLDGDTDLDLPNDTLTVNTTPVVGPSHGSLTLNADGTFSYTHDGSENFTDSFTYEVSDAVGNTDTATVTITITPVNDPPVIGGDSTGAVTEDVDPDLDTLVETTGTLTIVDPDVGESSFQAETIVGTYGSLTIDAAGNWSYSADNTQAAIQQLDAGESVSDVLTVTTADGTTHDVTITINGAEDTPVIGGTTTGSVTEDGSLTANGSLTITDVDTNDNPISFPNEASTAGDNGYGDFELAAGTWTYTLNNAHAAVQALDVGETLTDTHTFTASDGSTQVVTITINGAEDTPVIGGTTTGSVTEDGSLMANGTLTITDVDTSDNPISFPDEASTAGDNGYGDFFLNAGTWTYSLNNAHAAVQALDAGETLTDTHTFTASDGSTQVVTITINGTEDAPVIGGTTIGAVTEDGTLTANGTLTITDVDTSDNPISFPNEASTAGDNGYGDFVLTGGTWTYTLDNAHAAVQALDVGESLTDTHTFAASDGSTQVVTITINGTEDTPVIGGTSTGTVAEDGTLTANGTLTITDVDTSDNPISFPDEASTAGDNGYGDFVLNAGTWTYTLNNAHAAVQALDVGETLTDTHTFTASDGSTQVVTITINGAEDAPTLENAITDQTATEDVAFSFTFAANTFADVDASDTLTYSATLADDSALPAWLSFDAATRTFSGTPTNADVGTISVKVAADDGTSAVFDTFDITVNNASDPPVIGGDSTGAVTEDVDPDLDTLLETAEALTIADPDLGESSFQPATIVGTLGSLTIDAVGNWSYSADNTQAAIQQLDAGESVSDVLTVTTADGTTHDVTITINGAEDTPVIGGTTTGAVAEDGTLTTNGTLTITDVDTSDNPISFPDEASTAGDNGYGDFVLTAGTWTYTSNNAHATVQALDAGETLTDTHTFIASDGSTQVVTITINGTEDAPRGHDSNPGDDEETVPDPDPVSENPGTDEGTEEASIIEDEPVPPAEEYSMPDGSADADDLLVLTKDPTDDQALEIIYLTDENNMDTRSERREDEDSYVYFDNDYYKVLKSVGHLDIDYKSQEGVLELKDIPALEIGDFAINGSEKVVANEDYDTLREEIDETFRSEKQSKALKTRIVTATMTTFTVGIVSYLLQAGSMVTSMMSTLPLWHRFDPIAIFSGDKKKEKDRKEMSYTNDPKSETIFDGEKE